MFQLCIKHTATCFLVQYLLWLFLKSIHCFKNGWNGTIENVLIIIWGNWGPERLISYPRSHSRRQSRDWNTEFLVLQVEPCSLFPNTPLVLLWKQGYITIAYITLGLHLAHWSASVSTAENLALPWCEAQLPFSLQLSLLAYHYLEFIRAP